MHDQRASADAQEAFQRSAVPMLDCRTDGTVRDANAAAVVLLGLAPDELVDLALGELVVVEDAAAEAAARAELLAGVRAGYVARARLRRRDTGAVALLVTATHATDGRVAGLRVQLEPTTPRDRIPGDVADLREHALHDALTGLPTRPLLMDRIRAAARRAKRHGRPFACLFIDVDHFKRVNDTYGHAVGDRVLVEVAERARRRLRSQDTLSRLGGDEFVVVAEELDPDHVTDVVEEICESLLARLGEPLVVDHIAVEVSASIGAVVSLGAESAEELVHAADVAMYDAKRSGRACWRMHDPAMSTPGRVRHAVHQLLRTALSAHQVTVLHQPVVDLRDGSSVGVEALARIPQADGSVAEPRMFIPVAESTGLIHELGTLVLQVAAASAAAVDEAWWLAVNVSPRQLAERNFERVVLEVLEVHGLDPSRMVFDLTESDDLQLDDRYSVSNLRRLHEHGIRFALDDFGRGSSSLHRFRNLPVSFIKLDQTFVSGVANVGSGDLAVVRAVLGMAESMGVPVIAEGVETALQRQILRHVGVPMAQGYLFARPAPPVSA